VPHFQLVTVNGDVLGTSTTTTTRTPERFKVLVVEEV
jgi:hypothetical protein